MRHLKSLLAAALLATAPNALMTGFAQAQTCACPTTADEPEAPRGVSRVRIIADEAPPPLPEYDQPPLPAPGFLWTPGYWAWNNEEYYWVPGTWIEPPHPGLLWTPGYWGYVDGAYAFHRGYWGPHVGFYGGVAYGFGYYGAGFEGGRWDGDRFFYNRTVNNFGTVNIVNVYERPAPQVTVRVSFNGGAEGVRARPTAEEMVAAREPHAPPTVAQRRNVNVASHTESAFVSNNNGKPPVAATAKPGEFKGAAVAPAKAAGGPIKLKPAEEPTPAKADTAKPAAEPTTPEPKAEKAAPKAETPETKAEKSAPRGEKPEPKAERPEPKAERPEPKAEKPEPKAERPQPRAERPEPKAERPEPKAEAKPEPKADKPKTELERSKPDAKGEKPKAEAERPKPGPKPDAKTETPKIEPDRPKQVQVDHPKPDAAKPASVAEHPKPDPQRAAAAHAACRPGAPDCPK